MDRNGNSGKGEPSTCQNSFSVSLDVLVIPRRAAVDEPKLIRRRYQELRYQVSIFSFMSRGKSKNLDPPNKINFFSPGP